MKSITKVMVVTVALLLAAALFVAPAAARTGSISTISDGDTIFVYEEGLNLAGFGTVTSLNKYSDDDPTKALLNQIAVTTPGDFDLLASAVGGEYGVYYPDVGAALTTASPNVVIREPTVDLDVVLNESRSDSLDGKTVSKSTVIAFEIESPYVGAYYNVGGTSGYATVNVELTTPGGGKITQLSGQSLAGIALDGTRVYAEGIALTGASAGTYTAQAKWATPTGFANYATDSNTVTFSVSSKLLSIESNKDTVVRNNDFVVTVSGESKIGYLLYIKDASIGAAAYPSLLEGQTGVLIYDNATTAAAAFSTIWDDVDTEIDTDDMDEANIVAKITTNAAGTRSAEFATTEDTNAKTYTIKVVDPTDATNYDTVKVKVEKGDVTVTASGDQSYFLGEEVTFSGTNTDSETVYLFITGPNLPSSGGDLESPRTAGNQEVDVETDDTWEYKWDTSELALDAGTYTIYAVSGPATKDNVSDYKYQTVSIVVKKPFISASVSASTVAKGDSLFITGTAEGNPSQGVAIWVLGKNYYVRDTESVEDDGSFSYEFETTDALASGQYFVVVQHPMYNGQFDVVEAEAGDTVGTATVGTGETWVVGASDNYFIAEGSGALQGSDAAEALVQLINSPNIDDTYTKLSFLVEEAWIQIDEIGDKYVGDTFTITGTTNLAADDELLVEVVSSSFQPTEKTQSGEFSGASGTISITKGDTYNEWAFDVDASTFKPDEYIVKVESVESDTTATATFNVLAGAPPTEAPTEGPTEAPTGAPTEAPTEAPTTAPEPTPAPGFGALIALAGLGAVAVLVLRKH